MKRSSRVLALCLLGACAGVPALLIACGDDTVIEDNSGDAGTSPTVDPTGTSPTAKPTATVSPEGGPTDGGTDSGPSIFDGGAVQVDTFVNTFISEYCGNYAKCCTVPAGEADGKVFDQKRCETQTFTYGIENAGVAPDLFFADGGLKPNAANVEIDTAKAETCAQLTRSFPCGNGSAALYHATIDACAAALKGKLANGATCASTFECKDGRCLGGVCTAVTPTGGACSTSDQCKARGTTSLCRSTGDGGVDTGDGGKECVSQGGAGFSCNATLDCNTTGACNIDNTCSTSNTLPVGYIAFSDAKSCNGLRVDAGN